MFVPMINIITSIIIVIVTVVIIMRYIKNCHHCILLPLFYVSLPSGVNKPNIMTTTYMEPTMTIAVISVLIFGISKAKRIPNPHIPYRTAPCTTVSLISRAY